MGGMTSIIQPWLQPLIRPMRSVFREVFLLSLFINALALAVPVFIQQVYDRVVAHAGLSTLHGLVIGMALLLVFDYVLRQARARVLQTVALRIDIDVGELVFDKFMALPLRTLESRPSAAWQYRHHPQHPVRRNRPSGT